MTPSLPADLLLQIFALLPRAKLLECRLLNLSIGHLATQRAFRQICLDELGNASHFLRIAETEGLRCWVREITVSFSPLWIECHSEADRQARLLQRTRFLLALPRLSAFHGLQELWIKLQPLAVLSPFADQAQNMSLQSYMLDTAFASMIGGLTVDMQMAWQENWLSEFDVESWRPETSQRTVSRSDLIDVLLPPFKPQAAMNLTRLAILNVPSTLESYFDSSSIFKDFQNSQQQLTRLEILIATPRINFTADESVLFSTQYDFFENLPSSLLAPSLVANLRALSLFCDDYYGWVPKLDLRQVSGLSNLRSLALGHYVFSHEWQVAFIASLGRENGRGELQELYLDDCPILWRATTLRPLEEEGHNEGYPSKAMMTRSGPYEDDHDFVSADFELRWAGVLDTWRQSMQSLEVFVMGSEGDMQGQDMYTLRECLLQYVSFSTGCYPTPWAERDFQHEMIMDHEDGVQLYEESRTKDEESLWELLAAVDARAHNRHA